MVAPVTVSEKDLRTLLGIVACERGDLPPHGLPPSLLADLLSLIRCDGVNFFGMDTGQQTFWFDQQVPPGDDDVGVNVQVFWENYRGSDFCTYCARSGDLRSVTKLSDFYSARRWHSTALYSDYFRLYGTEHQLLMVLPAGPGPTTGPGRTVRLEFSRDERGAPDFSERDRALLSLLRPHLHQAYLDAERHRRGTPKLTPGSGNCCTWSPPGIPTPRSPGGSAYRTEPCASTCRTSTPGCRCQAAPPQSPAHSQTSQPDNS